MAFPRRRHRMAKAASGPWQSWSKLLLLARGTDAGPVAGTPDRQVTQASRGGSTATWSEVQAATAVLCLDEVKERSSRLPTGSRERRDRLRGGARLGESSRRRPQIADPARSRVVGGHGAGTLHRL
jgi:hypothetical protein